MSDLRRVVDYRNRAEILRTIAEVTEDLTHQRALRQVAEYYEKMAASLERELRERLG